VGAPRRKKKASRPPKAATTEQLLDLYDRERSTFEVFLRHIQEVIASTAPADFRQAVHSTRVRMKDRGHIAGKVQRKREKGIVVTCEKLFQRV
jgi:hypothetical protein